MIVRCNITTCLHVQIGLRLYTDIIIIINVNILIKVKLLIFNEMLSKHSLKFIVLYISIVGSI